MAAIENLEIIVNVDISKALAKLSELQDELRDLSRQIERVDTTSRIGIDVNLEHVDDELAALKAKLKAFEASESLDVGGVGGVGGGGPRTSDLAATLRAEQIDLPTEDLREVVDMRSIGGRGRVGAAMRELADGAMNARKSLGDFNLRMSDMHNMLARLIPLLLVFLGTVPALVTAFIGLATAAIAAAAGLMALAGFGALGVGLQGGQFDMQRISDVMSDIRDSFIEAFAPLAERLEPLFMDATQALEFLFQSIADRGDALMELTDEARAFGRFMMDWIPNVLAAMAAMVETLGPVFGDLADYLREAQILRTFAELTLDTIPAVEQMISILREAIPTIVRLSVGFTQVANIIMTLVGGFFSLLGVLPISTEAFGALIAMTLTAATVFALLNSAIISTAISMVKRLGAAILGAIGQLTGYSAAAMASTFATRVLYSALAALIGLTGIGLILVGLSAGASMVADRFGSAASNIESTTSALKNFDRVAGRTEGAFNPYEGGDPPVSGSRAVTGGGGDVIIETTGDRTKDNSNARYASFRQGRTTGSEN